MKKRWETCRKWERSKAEKTFEDMLSENSYEIVGYREYQSKTEYKIIKDNIVVEWAIHHIPNIDINGIFKSFEHYYRLSTEYSKLLGEQKGV